MTDAAEAAVVEAVGETQADAESPVENNAVEAAEAETDTAVASDEGDATAEES